MNISKISMMSNCSAAELDKTNRSSSGKVVPFAATQPANATSNSNFLNAVKTLGQVRMAETVSFSGSSDPFKEFVKLNNMTACKNSIEGLSGEDVGQHVIVSKLVDTMATYYDRTFPEAHSAMKTTLQVNPNKTGDVFTQLRTELLLQPDSHFLYSIENFGNIPKGQFCSVREGNKPIQTVTVNTTPGLRDEVAILQIKDRLTPIIRENDTKNVLLVANGELTSKMRGSTKITNVLWDPLPAESVKHMTREGLTDAEVTAIRNNRWAALKPEVREALEAKHVTEEKLSKIERRGKDEFTPYTIKNIPAIKEYPQKKSQGNGAVITIGLQEGRFCKELIASLLEFEKKIQKGRVPLPPFVAQPDADKMGILMLSGGFGSRAEYTNAASDAIYKNNEKAADNTKGSFTTPTGLTPMETSLVSLHLAGILDCSKGGFGIGKNLKFYMNKNECGNTGNGGFTLDMQRKVAQEKENFQFILPNDGLSRMPEAIKKVNQMMNEGNTAIAMIAKEVPAEVARGTFGVMKLEDGIIKEFAEKPTDDDILNAYTTDGNCAANTFQFAVSNEAFDALNYVFSDPNMKLDPNNKDARDWSSNLVPTIMVLSMFEKPEDMKTNLEKVSGKKGLKFLDPIPDEVLIKARDMLRGKDGKVQQVKGIVTPEFWYDVGQLPELYEAITEIAQDETNEKMLPWERRNVIDCVNPKTGLIASSPEQKAEIEKWYDVKGKVFATTKSKKIDPKILDTYRARITYLTKVDKKSFDEKQKKLHGAA